MEHVYLVVREDTAPEEKRFRRFLGVYSTLIDCLKMILEEHDGDGSKGDIEITQEYDKYRFSYSYLSYSYPLDKQVTETSTFYVEPYDVNWLYDLPIDE